MTPSDEAFPRSVVGQARSGGGTAAEWACGCNFLYFVLLDDYLVLLVVPVSIDCAGALVILRL